MSSCVLAGLAGGPGPRLFQPQTPTKQKHFVLIAKEPLISIRSGRINGSLSAAPKLDSGRIGDEIECSRTAVVAPSPPRERDGVRGNGILELTGSSEFVNVNSTPFHLCSVFLPTYCSAASCIIGSLAAARKLDDTRILPSSPLKKGPFPGKLAPAPLVNSDGEY